MLQDGKNIVVIVFLLFEKLFLSTSLQSKRYGVMGQNEGQKAVLLNISDVNFDFTTP